MTEESARSLKLATDIPGRTLLGADGTNLKVEGMTNVTIQSTCRSVEAPIYVLKGSSKKKLGLPKLRNLNLLGITNSMVAATFDPVERLPRLFSGIGTLPGIDKCPRGGSEFVGKRAIGSN